MLKVVTLNILYNDTNNAHLTKDFIRFANLLYKDYDILTHHIDEEDFDKIITERCKKNKEVN